MDEHQFQHLLKQTLDEEIQNVELWKQIEGKLPAVSRQTTRMGFRLGKVALIAILITITTVAVYALYQEVVVPGDPGITHVQQDELLTYYDERKLVEGQFSDHNLTVTLDYAYADANRLTVGYTVRGESPDGRRMMAYSNPTLTTDDGQALDRMFLLAEQENQEQPTESEKGAFSNTLTSNFIAKNFDLSEGELLNLRLKVEVALSYLDNGEFPSPVMMLAGSTDFTFAVPFIAGSVVEINQTVDAGDRKVTFQRASITPSMTRLDMCYELPPITDAPGWSPLINLSINGEQVFSGQAETYGLENHTDLNDPCRGVIIPRTLQGQAGEWQVEITEFRDLSGALSPLIEGPWAFTLTVTAN